MVALGLAVSLNSTGCRQKAKVASNQATITTTTEQTSSFETAIDFLNSLERYRPETVQQQILTNLGDWARQEKSAVDWLADPMVNDLPEELRPTESQLTLTAFERPDVFDLQEAIWLRDIARNVASQPMADSDIQDWLKQATDSQELTSDEASDLSLVFRLFDWTIRNTQLDPLDDPIDEIPGLGPGEPSRRHRYAPWECLSYGHADWIERARTHILLCRQLGIDCVMLAIERGDDQPDQPWCVGAWIGGKLFLFDTLLGLPLPGQGRAPLSTLSEYVQQPALLDGLIAGTQPYRIATSDLKNVIALLDASASALSQRMKQIETRLAGTQKMMLTATPTSLARALRANESVNGSRIWLEPYQAIQAFRQFLQEPTKAPKLLERLEAERLPFVVRSPLMQGRLLHFRGKYRGDKNNFSDLGANKLYMNSRLPKRELDRFSMSLQERRDTDEMSPFLQGLPRDPAEAQKVYQERVAREFRLAVWSKDNASLWLAMIAFEKQEFEVAKNHLERLLENEDTKWRQTARYNLARAYEAMGKSKDDAALVAKAIEIYKSDQDTPQYAGNLLRAKRLVND